MGWDEYLSRQLDLHQGRGEEILGYDVYDKNKRVFENLTLKDLEDKREMILNHRWSILKICWDGSSHRNEWVDL